MVKLAGSAAIAIVFGVAVLLLRRDALALAPPPTCAGLLESIGAGVARLAPALPIGSWFALSNALTSIVALLLFAMVAFAASRTWIAAIAATAAFATLPMFTPVLAPLATAGIAIAGVTWLSLLRSRRDRADGDRRLRLWTWCTLLLAALVAPGLTWPLALVAGWHAATLGRDRPSVQAMGLRTRALERWSLIVASAGLLALGSWLFQLFVVPRLPPSLPGATVACLLPGPAAFRDVVDSARWVILSAGPFAAALAMLGAFSRRAAFRDARIGPLVAYAVAPLAVVAWPSADADAGKLLGPSLVACWALAGIGLGELIRACGSRLPGRLAASALVLLLPGFQLLRLPPRTPAALIPQGQDELSRTTMRSLLDVMPDRTVLVAEDAITDVLLRSLDGMWQRARKTLYVVARDAPTLAEWLRAADAPAFALPGAQADLQYLGFQLSEATLFAGVAGLAQVRVGGTCRPLGAAWHRAPDLARSATFAVVAQDDRSRDSIVIFAAADRPLNPRAHDWPGATTRGFLWDAYDLDRDADKGRLASAGSADQLRHESIHAHRYVLRFVLHWMPDAPRVLAVDVGNPPDEVVGRIDSNDARQRFVLCPAFPYERARLSVPR